MRYAIRRTPPQAWSASGSVNFDIQSTLNEFRAWKFPTIHAMTLIFDVTSASTGVSGFVPRTLPSYIAQNLLVNDVGGQRVNMAASSLHNLCKAEFGLGYANAAAIAASQSAQTLRFYMPIPVKPHKARRDRDYTMPVREFLDGGSCQLTAGAATQQTTGLTIAAANYYILFHIVDEGAPELKSRYVLRDQAITSNDFAGYPIGGFVRQALWYNGEVNESAASGWAAAKYDSNTLGYIQQQDTDLRELFLRQHNAFRKDSGTITTASAIVDEDPVVTGQVIPLIWPQLRQKITDMAQMPTLHVRTSGSITTSDKPKLITAVLEERNPTASARTLGRSDVGKAIEQGGRVKTANGEKKSVHEFPVDLANVLPVKVGPGGK